MANDMQLYLPDDILVKIDRASMYNSLEVRSPLLDKDLFEYCWTLSINDKVFKDKRKGKKPLYDILEKYIPGEIINRPKMGFSPPVAKWLRSDLKDWASGLLSKEAIETAGMYDYEQVNKLWSQFINNGIDHHKSLWVVLMAQSWFIKYKNQLH
jgi:asparagine synthase (glutamine-hydrolysing)